MEYLTEMKVIKGLYITLYFEKIMHNCQYFNIEMYNTNDCDSFSKISKIIDFSIVTTFSERIPTVQFKVKQNLKIKELNRISKNLIPDMFKSMIMQAYNLVKIKTLRDLNS